MGLQANAAAGAEGDQSPTEGLPFTCQQQKQGPSHPLMTLQRLSKAAVTTDVTMRLSHEIQGLPITLFGRKSHLEI